MENFWVQILTILLAGVTGIWKGVPVGIALQAHPFVIAVFTALGSIVAVLVIFFSGEPLKRWLLKKYGRDKLKKKEGRFSRLMNRYGIAGIGLIGCGLIGPILSTLLGLVMINKPQRLIIFLVAGIILWSSILTIVADISIELFQYLFGQI